MAIFALNAVLPNIIAFIDSLFLGLAVIDSENSMKVSTTTMFLILVGVAMVFWFIKSPRDK